MQSWKKNKLEFIETADPFVVKGTGKKQKAAIFKCDCGNTKRIRIADVLAEKTKTCGCSWKSKKKAIRRVDKSSDYLKQVRDYYYNLIPDVEKDKFYVYGFFLASGVPFYIGKGLNKRLTSHFSSKELLRKSYKNHKLFKLFNERHRVRIEVLCYSSSEQSALDTEVFLIRSYGRCQDGGILTNVSEGGVGTSGVSPSEESRQKRSEKQSGVNNPFYGKTHTEKSKRLISENAKQRVGYKNKSSDHTLWIKADFIFNLWKESPMISGTKLTKILNISKTKEKPIRTMIKMFNDGWVPSEDIDWLNYKGLNNALD